MLAIWWRVGMWEVSNGKQGQRQDNQLNINMYLNKDYNELVPL